MAYQTSHIFRQGRRKMEPLPCKGMGKRQRPGMKGLAANQFQGAPIQVISQQGVTQMGEMDPYLMGSPGEKMDSQ